MSNNLIFLSNEKLLELCNKARQFAWWYLKDQDSAVKYYQNLQVQASIFCQQNFTGETLEFFQSLFSKEIADSFEQEMEEVSKRDLGNYSSSHFFFEDEYYDNYYCPDTEF